MAKKTLDFGKLALPEKPVVIQKNQADTHTERAVETIHTTPSVFLENVSALEAVATNSPSLTPSIVSIEQPVEAVKKISLDLPVEVYTYIKMHTFKRRITMREYLLELIYKEKEFHNEV